MGIDFFPNRPGASSIYILADTTYAMITAAVEELELKTGVYLDLNNDATLTAPHVRLFAGILRNGNYEQQAVKDFIEFLDFAAAAEVMLIAAGD